MSDNNSIWDISSKTIILAVDLVVDESLNLPQRVAAALQTPGVKKTIRKALEAEAKKLVTAHSMQTHITITDTSEAKDIAGRIGKNVLTAVKDDVLHQLKQSDGVSKLKNNIRQLQKEFKRTAVGAWINENEKVLYIVAGVAAFGAAAGMYYFKSGDFVAKFAEGKGKAVKLGSLTLKGTLTKFEPSTRSVGAEISTTGNFKPVKVDLKLTGLTVGKNVRTTSEGEIVIPINKRIAVRSQGRIQFGDLSPSPLHRQLKSEGFDIYTYSIGLGLSLKEGNLAAGILASLEEEQGKKTASLSLTGRGQTNSFNYRWALGVNTASEKTSFTGSFGLTGMGKYKPLGVALEGGADTTGDVRIEAKLILLEF